MAGHRILYHRAEFFECFALGENVETERNEGLTVGGDLKIKARVHLGPMDPAWVEVQAYMGSLTDQGAVELGRALPMKYAGHNNGMHEYEGSIPCELSGRFGYEVRVIPRNAHLISPFVPGLITWG